MKNLNKREQSVTYVGTAEHKKFRTGLKDFAAIDFETANNERSPPGEDKSSFTSVRDSFHNSKLYSLLYLEKLVFYHSKLL